jgi:hypothetical protein
MIEVFRKHLQNWPGYAPQHSLESHVAPCNTWIGYRTSPQVHPFGTTHFDVNITESASEPLTFYLLHIELEAALRGIGLGARLYELLTEIARELDCKRIVQTPSGWTPSGETRDAYLQRRGWLPLGNYEVYKPLE